MKKGRDLNVSTLIEANYNGWDTTLIVVILFCLLSIPKTPKYKQFIPILVMTVGLMLLILHSFLISRPFGFICLISFYTRATIAFLNYLRVVVWRSEFSLQYMARRDEIDNNENRVLFSFTMSTCLG